MAEASGGERRKRTNDEVAISTVELQPDFKTIQVCLVENIKYLNGHKMFGYTLYLQD